MRSLNVYEPMQGRIYVLEGAINEFWSLGVTFLIDKELSGNVQANKFLTYKYLHICWYIFKALCLHTKLLQIPKIPSLLPLKCMYNYRKFFKGS